MTNFTKGPWHVEPEEASEGRGLAICAEDAIVATITPEDDRQADAEDWANARLIAAAPDLLAALEVAWRWQNSDLEDEDEVLNIMAEAIAKATGKEAGSV